MKRVFLTGASSGMGAQLARLLAQRGDRLGLFALAGDDLNRAADVARTAGAAEVHVYGGDVRDREAMRHAVADFTQKAGGLDVFIGCAGVDFDIPIDDFRPDRVEFIFDVNLRGLMYGANAAVEIMLRQGSGHIVGVASLAGWRIMPTHADYSASKAAVIAYLEALRIRLRRRSIAVTTVAPGFVRTPMTANHPYPMPFALTAERAAQRILRGIDRRRNLIAFPGPLVWGTRLLGLIPDTIWRVVIRFIG